MTNDLFRDLLEGRIPTPRKRIRPGIYFLPKLVNPAAPTMNELAAGVNISHILTVDGFSFDPHPHAAPAHGWDDWGKRDSPPADPRARALWAKEQQGHGPELGTLRNRGRVMRYREKG